MDAFIFVMEQGYRSKLSKTLEFPSGSARLIGLDIPHDFGFMDPDLIRLLKHKASRCLPLFQAELT